MLRKPAVLREVNDRVREVSAARVGAAEPIGFLCECGDPDCLGVVDLTIAEYEAIRSVPNRFLLLAGHERPGADGVVARDDRYVIVAPRAAPSPATG